MLDFVDRLLDDNKIFWEYFDERSVYDGVGLWLI